MARVFSAKWGAFGILVLFGTVHYTSAICFFYAEKYFNVIRQLYWQLETTENF